MKIKFNSLIIYLFSFFVFSIASVESNISKKKKIDISKVFDYMIDEDIRCFLNIIALCEGTSKNKSLSCFKPSWNEYCISFGYTQKIDLNEYPNRLFCPRGKKYFCGSAAGRYQFIKNTWNHITKKHNQEKIFHNNKDYFEIFHNNIGLYYDETVALKYKTINDIINYKFGPFWQDFYAIILLMEANIIKLIKNKKIEEVCKKISFIWPSFPRNNRNQNRYNDGINNAKSFSKIVKFFEQQMRKRIE